MQGLAGRPITMKPGFIRPSRAKFQVGAVTMDASSGGSRAVVLIFLSGNNPVKYTDPDGRWVPDFDGKLIAESGDNAKYNEALKQLTDQGYTVDENGILNLKIGDKIKLDNVYTRSIANAIESPTTDQLLAGDGWIVNDYNCWGSAIAGSKNNEIKKGVGIPTPGQFESILKLGYSSISGSSAIFGKTVLKFGNESETQHAAVFYGQSRDGTVYIYTKNGWHARPGVMKLSELQTKIPSYGSVTGYYNSK
jgi:hypothetical protein